MQDIAALVDITLISSIMSSSSFSTIIFTTFYVLILSSQSKHASSSSSSSSCFKSIIAFGDSIEDTGNLPYLYKSGSPFFFEVPPYGETFFHHPSGRCSDGRLIIDFIATYLGLPFVPPFFDGKNSSGGGSVNFAVAGASAMPDSFLVSRGIQVPHANVSLGDQLRWFKELFLPKFYHKSSDRKLFLEELLIMVGEIGGNDYNHALVEGNNNMSTVYVATIVPSVIKSITSTINELIKLGAVTLMVPGNFPIGCSPTYLTRFKSSNKNDYDPKTGCINLLNKFSRYHNTLLQSELNRIQEENPTTKIIYADYYNSAMRFYDSPEKYGFAKGGLAACCGGCGPYIVDPSLYGKEDGCCEDPSEYVSWDGVHLTEAAYRLIATSLVRGSYTIPQFNSICASSRVHGISDH